MSLLVLGDNTYTPTQLQTQTLLAYLQDDEGKSPAIILEKTGHCRDNWWKWLSRYPNFIAWWNRTIERVFTDQRLADLYQALYRRGLKHDTAAVKLLMQRFDKNYTERSQQDQRHSFAGYDPPLADESRERQRKAIASRSQPALPAGEPVPANAITGAVPVHPALTPDTHAQSPSIEQEPGKQEQASNDNTLDSKPITQVSTPGPGLQE